MHRNVYTDAAIFELEMQRLWARAWLFVGHASQVPHHGDFIATTLATRPVLMLRHSDGAIHVLHNRCAHRGAQLCTQASGNAGATLRCPYHGWSYRTDGTLLGVPLREGYANSGFESSPAALGLARYGAVAVHRGFVFARESVEGPSFEQSLGELVGVLDILADRSPRGELQIAGGVLRTLVRANWKLYLENINDAFHPVTAHASVNMAAQSVWKRLGAGATPPAAMQQLLPFGSGYEFFDQMGGRTLPHGHSILGTSHSIHNAYADVPGYAELLMAAHGEARARRVLGFVPQNVVIYPSLALKGAPQVMRIVRPIAVDKTVVEAWSFQPVGAPAELLDSALLYNRLVFSPMSIVAHDDLHLFEAAQRGLASGGNEWVSLQRGATAGARESPRNGLSGIDEALVLNQYRAWLEGMAPQAAA